MKNLLKGILSLTLVAVFFVSCEETESQMTSLIPKDAVAYIQWNNPAQSLVDIDANLRSFGLESFLRDKSVDEMVEEMIKMESPEFTIDLLNLSSPMALAVLPNNGSLDQDPVFRVLVPSKDSETLREMLIPIMDNLYASTATEGYLILDSGPVPEDSATLDPSVLSPINQNTFSYYVDLVKIRELTDFDATFRAAALEGLEDMSDLEAAGIDQETAVTLIGYLDQFLKDLFHLDGGLVFNTENLGSNLRLSFAEGSPTSEFLASVSTGEGIEDLLKYLPQSAVLNMAYKGSSEELNTQLMEFSKLFYGAFPEDLATQWMTMNDQIAELMGEQGLFSLDFTITPEMMSSLEGDFDSPEQIINLLQELDLKVLAMAEVTDPGAYQTILDENATGERVMDIIRTVVGSLAPQMPLEMFGLSFDIVKTDNPLGLSQRNEKWEFELTLNPLGAPEEEIAMINDMIARVLDLFDMVVAYQGNWVIAGLGNEELVASILSSDSLPEPSIAQSPIAQQILSTFPVNKNLLGNFNISWILDIASATGIPLPPLNIGDEYPGFMGYATVSGGYLESGFGFSIDELQAILAPLGPLFGLMLGGGGGF